MGVVRGHWQGAIHYGHALAMTLAMTRAGGAAVQHGGPVVFEHGEEALAGGQVVLKGRERAGARARRDHVDGAVAAVFAPQDAARACKHTHTLDHSGQREKFKPTQPRKYLWTLKASF